MLFRPVLSASCLFAVAALASPRYVPSTTASQNDSSHNASSPYVSLVSPPTAPPHNDSFQNSSFFQAHPTLYHLLPNGAIVKARQLPVNGTIAQANLTSAIYQFLYKTTDANDEPTTQVVTLWVPQKNNSKPTKHLAYSFAYDSSYIDCSPSYTVQKGVGSFSIGGENAAINAALGLGYFVSSSDYEGKKASFTNGVQAGRGVLDSIRAVTYSSYVSGVSPRAESIVWGYSGGALASEWAAELHESYAPEVKLIGAALGGLTPNVTSVAYTVNKSLFVGLVPAGIWGISNQFKNLTDYIYDHLKPNMTAKFEKAKSQCLIQDVGTYASENIFDYFDGGDELFSDPVPLSIINSVGIMGSHGVPKFPIYAYKGVKDQISVVADTDKLIKGLCDKGANIYYARYPTADHVSLPNVGSVAAFQFIQNAFSNITISKGCHNVTTNGTKSSS